MELVPSVQESLFDTNNLSQNATNVSPYFPYLPITDTTSAEYAKNDTKPNQFMVSYSEIQAYKECKRKHYYAFTQALAPAVKADPLTTGNVGHRLLEVYYSSRDIAGRNAAVDEVHKEFDRLNEEANYNRAVVVGYKGALAAMLNDPFLSYEVETVEHTYYVPLFNEVGLAGTIDLLLSQGKDYTVVDHKFVGRPWTSAAFMISSQLDIYAAMLDYHGVPITKKAYNFIYTQTLQTKVESFELNPNKTRRIIQELAMVAEEIENIYDLDSEEQDRLAIRVLQPIICRGCAYLDLCYSEMVGDEERIRKAESVLIPNDYGYRRNDGSG